MTTRKLITLGFALVALFIGVTVGGGNPMVAFDTTATMPDWWAAAGPIGWTTFQLAVILLVGGSWLAMDRYDDLNTDDPVVMITSAIVLLASILLLYLMWITLATAENMGVALGLAFVGFGGMYIGYTYLQYRAQHSRAGVPERRTRGKINRDIRDTVKAVGGLLLLLVSIVTGSWAGISQIAPEFGDQILAIAPELAYLGTAALGWLTLSGSIDMSPEMYVGLAMVIGGLALVLKR